MKKIYIVVVAFFCLLENIYSVQLPSSALVEISLGSKKRIGCLMQKKDKVYLLAPVGNFTTKATPSFVTFTGERLKVSKKVIVSSNGLVAFIVKNKKTVPNAMSSSLTPSVYVSMDPVTGAITQSTSIPKPERKIKRTIHLMLDSSGKIVGFYQSIMTLSNKEKFSNKGWMSVSVLENRMYIAKAKKWRKTKLGIIAKEMMVLDRAIGFISSYHRVVANLKTTGPYKAMQAPYPSNPQVTHWVNRYNSFCYDAFMSKLKAIRRKNTRGGRARFQQIDMLKRLNPMLRATVKQIDIQGGHIVTNAFARKEAKFFKNIILTQMIPRTKAVVAGYKDKRAYGSKSKGAKYHSLR